jgi:hypothetical protein
MKKIIKGKVLILTDIHQAVGGYAEHILARETDWDHIILNGDYIDTHHTPDGAMIYGVDATIEWLNEKFKEWGKRASWHIGNHDVAYLASYNRMHPEKADPKGFFCSGWTPSKARTFNKRIDPEWIDNLELCTQLGDNTIVSHAGFQYQHFVPLISELNNIERLCHQWKRDRHVFMRDPYHWIWEVGQCRGGSSTVGSPVWLDWNDEFIPIDNIQQIVGHTSQQEPALRRMINSSFLVNLCIDCMQQTYAVWEDGKITVKNLDGSILTS